MAQINLKRRLQDYNLPGVMKTDRLLGRGAFGKVIEMKLPDGTIVAGKKFYNDSTTSEDRVKIEEECLR